MNKLIKPTVKVVGSTRLVVCPKCGEEYNHFTTNGIEINKNYCSNCGVKFDWVIKNETNK